MLAVVKVREVSGSTVITIPYALREYLGWSRGYQVILKAEKGVEGGLGKLTVEAPGYVDESSEVEGTVTWTSPTTAIVNPQ